MAKTKAHMQAEDALPLDLRETFNVLVEEYRAAAEAHTGQAWVNYQILSDLVLAGWRKMATKDSE